MEVCPHCGDILHFISPVLANVEIYGNTVNGTTSCCGNIVTVNRVISFAVSIPDGHNKIKEDAWGNKNKGYKK